MDRDRRSDRPHHKVLRKLSSSLGDSGERVSQRGGPPRGISEIMSVVVEGEEEPVQGVARRTVQWEDQVLCLKRCHHSRGHVCVQKFRLHIEYKGESTFKPLGS